ncbi:uncharacterized protein [Halyomorpha halys]|uniref:uncharacterized protein n=1 Tax=Halyomorpha halys TaxID=286706 RepID=UPI0006D4EC91|nr:uncharacterized protein LOC106688482 [Halyomorpha halys]
MVTKRRVGRNLVEICKVTTMKTPKFSGKRLINERKDKQTIRNVKDEGGRLITGDQGILERWRFFSGNAEEQMIRESVWGEYNEVIWQEEVDAAVERLRLGKAAGRDDIVPELIKYEVTEKAIPKEWEYNIIVPIRKKDNANECENYRPICLSQVVYKLYTSILEKKLRELVEKDLEEEQAVFRPQHQTQDHIFSLRTIIDNSWERGKGIFLEFIDLKAAFD